MQILISALDGGLHRIEVAPETTIAALKAQIGASEEILSFGSSILDNQDATLSSLDISNGASLAINARLLGGKVHGSLARAGKVRAQTPKVDKQERTKKRVQGRAARRIQYVRRFVNVATGPGKKRGPNSNAA